MISPRAVTISRVALHLLFAALLAIAVRGALAQGGPRGAWSLVLCAVVGVVYLGGGALVGRGLPPGWWMTALVATWAGLVLLDPDAAYLAFPLFFLALHLLGVRLGTATVVLVCAFAVVAIGLDAGWTTGGIVGPVVAAVAAIAIGIGYRALADESRRRAELIDELVATRAELADREREAGRDAERARLAGELHDTVAQGLSSIAMLLGAALRSAPEHPQARAIELARDTAAESLVETRRFIAELRPVALEGTTLGSALARHAASLMERGPHDADGRPHPLVEVRDSLDADVPVPVASALLRVAQEAIGNAVRHGAPDTVSVDLDELPDASGADSGTAGDGPTGGWVRLRVVDDGTGFDPEVDPRASSFGLEGMAQRARALGGRLEVRSEPGAGTAVVVAVPRTQGAPS